MTTDTDRRMVIEDMLSSREYSQLVERVEFLYHDHKESLDEFWDFALGLPAQWEAMSKLPARASEKAVAALLATAKLLVEQLGGSLAEVHTLKGFTAAELCLFLERDVADFVASMEKSQITTDVMQVRPRGMGKATAERTFYCRALTRYLLEDGLTPSANIVSMLAPVLLGQSDTGEFSEKEVRDLTEDICREFRQDHQHRRSMSRVLTLEDPSK